MGRGEHGERSPVAPGTLGRVDEPRTDRVGLLIDQLTDAVALSRLRIDGITNDELSWEPFAGMWSIRRRGQATSTDAYGPGDFVLDFARDHDPFAGGPLTTAVWRIAHLASGYAGRYEWTFGTRSTPPEDLVAFRPDTTMLDRLWSEIDRWAAAVESLDDASLDQVGFGQYPHGLDPELPFITIVRWMNRETIHHLAEVALLRDLYERRDAHPREAWSGILDPSAGVVQRQNISFPS